MLNKSSTMFSLVLMIVLFFSSMNYCQSSGRIKGKIIDSSTGDGLPGANIILLGTNMGSSSDRFGNYSISSIPAGEYTLKASYIGYKDYTTKLDIKGNRTISLNITLSLNAIKLNQVVVNGLLQGQTKALNQQMNANDIKDVLSREEMQKFPDMNTAESLQRIPGVYISRSLGEGDQVYIRGTAPNLTRVTVNGQSMPTDNATDRIVDLGVINSSQLASISVVKSVTPDMSADAIGGTVNLITKSPFDYNKNTLNLDVAGGYADQAALPLYRFSGTYTGFFSSNKKIGFSVNGSYYRDNIRAYSNQYGWDNEQDINGNVIPFAVSSIDLFDYNTHRNHYGASGELDFRPDNNNSYYIRGMYNRMDDWQYRNDLTYNIAKGNYLTATTIAKTRLDFEFQTRDEAHSLATGSVGGTNELGDSKIDYDLTYGWGKQVKQGPGSQIKSDWELNEKPNVALDLSNIWFPKISMTNVSNSYAQDPANWAIDNQDWRATDIVDNTFTGDFNFNKPYSIGILPGNIKMGVKLSLDQKKSNNNRIKYKWKGNNTIYMSSVTSGEVVNNFMMGHYVFAPEISNSLIRAFINQYAGQNDALRPYVNYMDPDGQGGDFDTKENVYAAYAMGTLNIGNLLILAGVRNEYTHTDYKGTQILFDNNGNYLNALPIDNKRDYNNFFPNLQLRFKITPKTNLRFAFTETIARPNYFDLAPYDWVDPSSDAVQRGNPDLSPTTSTNFDLMLGHYFQGIGVISAGLFYKNMDKVIYSWTYRQVGGAYDGFDITEPVNGGKAELYGLELNWMQQFTFLPGIFNAFGIYGNYTFTKSKADLLYRNWNVLPGQAGNVGNLGISFERFGITARLSFNYSAKVLTEVGVSPAWDRYMDHHAELDFAGMYKLFNNLSYYLNLINITNEPYREFIGNESRPRVSEYYGWSIRTGLKYNL